MKCATFGILPVKLNQCEQNEVEDLKKIEWSNKSVKIIKKNCSASASGEKHNKAGANIYILRIGIENH